MKHWFLMTAINMLIPASMLGFGLLFSRRAPKNINFLFGYRTSMSMKNKDTWEYAHKTIGKLWSIAGLVLLAASIVVMLWVADREDILVSKVGTVLCCVQLAVMFLPVVPTEIALRRNFDKSGNRR